MELIRKGCFRRGEGESGSGGELESGGLGDLETRGLGDLGNRGKCILMCVIDECYGKRWATYRIQ